MASEPIQSGSSSPQKAVRGVLSHLAVNAGKRNVTMEDVTEQNIIDELQWRGLINQSTDVEALREACGIQTSIVVSTRQVLPSTQVTSFRCSCCVVSSNSGMNPSSWPVVLPALLVTP